MGYIKYKDEIMSKPRFIAHRREKDGAEQYLEEHLEEVSILAGKFAKKINLEKHGELIGLLHDLGKATFEFYQYIGSATGLIDPDEDDYIDASGKKGKIDHSSAGAQLIHQYFSEKGKESIFVSQILSLIIASHHSGIIDCLTPDGIDNYSRRMNKSEEKTRTKEALESVNETIRRKIEELLSDNNFIIDFNIELKSLQETNDSNDTFMFKAGLLTRFLFSCLIDADRLNTADFEFPERVKMKNQGNYIPWQILIDKLEKHLKDLEIKSQVKNKEQKKVNKLRNEIANHCLKLSNRSRGLYQLTVPTGGGKTLSSLRFALNHASHHEMERIIYVIPYTSIIDQNADTVRKIMEGETKQGTDLSGIVLEHHSNLTPEEETNRQKLLAENWDAPIVFTTMVQLLETLFGYGTRNARRMHQLANAVIIFDEIQTLPVKCVHVFNVAVRFLIKACATVILCTATQPLLNSEVLGKRALSIGSEQQMMPDVRKLFEDLKRVKVFDRCKIGGWTNEEIADLVDKELSATGSVLAIVNTKKSAAALFRLVHNNSRAKVYHLSTNMCPAHRLQYLEEIKDCLTKEQPVICVSTQLIEAGVDVDFGSVIRYLAGLDSIAQAAGRCNRNGARPQRGRVFIVNPIEENINKLADIKIGREKAERILTEFKTDATQFEEDILGLKAMEHYYQYYFYERKGDMNYIVNSNSVAGRADSLFDLLATNPKSVQEYQRVNSYLPETFLRQSFMTASKIFEAIDSRTQGVIVPYGQKGKEIISKLCGVRDLYTQYSLLKEAQRYSVNVYCNQYDELIKQKIIFEVQEGVGIFYLNDQYYSEEYGMSEDKVKEMNLLST